ncbi:uncharacterized protein BCR38DRAFT_469504 [Pseudomassariella vexata]|uniref:Zn(2)-C6 fungal-type domain-containing protein n=1 Tax=Pseudomassariella vexata TaxID=1141098 RepID=A0A1Y2DAW2_9PEZI|nr:uncharacterized protein BCR38DRAFT_469504 [Pseudomassariella vexata]ORY56412.1 hypothetical protein BCR38DRAFT_469504 [Pseudomassariella vexata]
MSVLRSCLPCRSAKTKCDLVRPTCGRCSKRGTTCSGFPPDEGFIFRDENEEAQRNSARARGEKRYLGGLQAAFSWELQTSPYNPRTTDDAAIIYQQYPWPNASALSSIVPPSLQLDLDTCALDRFFVNWTLHPCNHGVSPGHMDQLPRLYLSAAPGSVLWHAIRAVAFADMRYRTISARGETPFHIRAWQQYGEALKAMRALALGVNEGVADDSCLAAILLIDNFELMYLARNGPLGPHSDAIRYILHTRGDSQLLDRSGFALWRIAHHRLQSRQLLLREEPDAEQTAAAANKLLDESNMHRKDGMMPLFPDAVLQRAKLLVSSIRELNASVDSWAAKLTGVWKPEVKDPRSIPISQVEEGGFPVPRFPCPRFLSYHDICLAYLWNPHAASQLVLRESLVDVIRYISSLGPLEEGDEAEAETFIEEEKAAVEWLSSVIIRSLPPLLGFTHRQEGRRPHSFTQGKMAGRLFSLFSMWVVERAQFTSVLHKQTAREVTAWINSSHRLL